MVASGSRLNHLALLIIFACVTNGWVSALHSAHEHSRRHLFQPLHKDCTTHQIGATLGCVSTSDQTEIDVPPKSPHKKRDAEQINQPESQIEQTSLPEQASNRLESDLATQDTISQQTIVSPDLDPDTQTSCPGSCKGRCNYVVDATNVNMFPCHCDHACWLYGDCCIDYYPSCLHTDINATDDKILTATLGALQNYSAVLNFREHFEWSRLSRCFYLTSGNTYFQIVAQCSSEIEVVKKFQTVHRDLTNPEPDSTKYFMGLSQDEIKQRCERELPLKSNQTVLDQTHVSLNRSPAIHFYNVFCAICNGVRPSQVSAWTTKVTCDSTTLSQSDINLFFGGNLNQGMINSSNCVIQNIEDPAHLLRSCFPYKHYASNSEKRSPNHISDSINSYNNSSCCEPSHDLNTTLCKRYQYAYLNNKTQTFYKNPHCYICFLRHSTSLMATSTEADMISVNRWITATMCKIKEMCFCQNNEFSEAHNEIPLVPIVALVPELDLKKTIPSFRILLDFQSRQTTLTINETTRIIETKSCPQSQVYVPLVNTCRRVNCMPGTRWQDNRCVPVACPETASEVNETCQDSKGQTFNYSYRPFPEGSTFISLDISLEYIFGPVRANGPSLEGRTRKILVKKKKGLQIKTENDNYSQKSGGKKCSVFSRNTSGLFEVSSLKKMWVEQIKRNNSTKLNHEEYDQIVNEVRQLIRETVNVHTRNQSLNVKAILCSGSTCLRCSLPFQQNASCSYKQPPHNPCLSGPMRQSDFQHRVQRSDECLSFGIHLKSSADLDVVLKVARVMVTDIITVAHDNNFLVSRAELTNNLDDRSDQPTREAETKTSQGNDEGFITNNSSQLCQSGERVTFKETNVELSQNGTYIVHFNGHQTPLGAFSFRTELDVHSMTSEGEIKATNISWCQTDLSKLQCESMQYEVYNSSNFVFINGTLVLTNMAETFTQFLGNISTRMTTMDELVSLFPKMFAGGNATIVKEGQYIATRSEVLACSNFSNTYQQENETFHTSTRFVFMPYSKEEIIATMLSSVISITCLTGTLAVYSFLPSLQNVPGKIVMSLSAALVCAQILFLTCQKPEGLACEIYAAFHHAAWLASFSWLTALSVDLAYILNCQSSMNCDTSRNNIFKFLSAVCWGVPLMFSGICFVLFKTHFVSMGYGQNGVCWIGNMQSLLLSFGVPVFVIIAVTSGCAVAVVKAIGNSVSFRSRSTSSRRKSRKQVIVCVNLCLLMGFTWLFYFLAVGVGNTVLWALHSFVNGSQGLYIFLCFVARKSLMLKLVTKLKLINIWSRKPYHAGESSKAKMAATITTPTSSPCSSINLKHLNNDKSNQSNLNAKG